LPWAFDRQALDLIAQPVYAEACSHFEIDPRRLDDTYVVGERKLHDVESGIVRIAAPI